MDADQAAGGVEAGVETTLQDDAQDLDQTLNLDSQKTTRTIRATANTPDEINEMFDGIAYGKAGAVIGMVETLHRQRGLPAGRA